MADVALFDFLSHETMHQPFNEGYIRVLRAAFPADRIIFHARPGHLDGMAPRLADIPGLALRPIPPLQLPHGFSHHNPIAGYLAAWQCRRAMAQAMAGLSLRLVTLLGVDNNLFFMVARRWSKLSPAPLHLILHGQLGETMIWRSRNPFIRAADLASQLRHALPGSVRLVALELGVADAIADLVPVQRCSLVTLEHPVLVSEWVDTGPRMPGAPLQIGFLGHARRAKGYHVFAELARRVRRPDLEFLVVGRSAADTDSVDGSALHRLPTPGGMAREDYLGGLAGLDLVCLPLHSGAYDFTASGTVSDAIAARKPLLAIRNRTLDAMVARYGEIGYLADSSEALFTIAAELDIERFLERLPLWTRNIEAIREARRPEHLAPGYAALVPSGDPSRPTQ